MDTRTKGDIAEAAVLNALTASGLLVLTPFGRFGPYDLVAETRPGAFVRIQVKSGRIRDDCVIANARSTDHGSGRQSYTGRVDAVAIHAPAINQQFIVPIESVNGFEIRLRLTPTRNNQRRRIRFAADYRLTDWVTREIASPTSALTAA